jgi:hypothetical protein
VKQPTPEALRVAESARSIALQMLEERGRGAVLVGVARVDAALVVLLKASLAPPSGSETLFVTDRPLGSFGARIGELIWRHEAAGEALDCWGIKRAHVLRPFSREQEGFLEFMKRIRGYGAMTTSDSCSSGWNGRRRRLSR